MTSWATPAQAIRHWPDAATLDPARLLELLDLATTACAAYAPEGLELNTAAATLRTNLAPNPIGPNVTATTGLGTANTTLSLGAGYVRGTFTTATLSAYGQSVYLNFFGTSTLPITTGVPYAVTLEARCSIPNANVLLQLRFNDAAGTNISGPSSGTFVAGPTAFVPVTFASSHPTATNLTLRVGLDATTPRNIGDWIDVRRVIVEQGAATGAWFDGDTTATGTQTYAWVPPLGTSPSATETTTPYLVPANYMLACVYQAREVYQASIRDGDLVGAGDLAYRARPLTSTVKQLLRPETRGGVA